MTLVTALIVTLMPLLVPGAPGQKTVQAALQAAADRHAAPAFQLHDARGKTVRLSDFKGRVTVVNLWATECGGCKAELPTFVQLHKTYHERGLAVVGVSMDVMYEDLESLAAGWMKVKPFAAAHGLAYTIVMDDSSVEKAYNVTALPATYLIDKQGRTAAAYVGIVDPADLESNVKTLLTESK